MQHLRGSCRVVLFLAASFSLFSLAGCDCEGRVPTGCFNNTDCPAGQRCVGGMCVERPDAADVPDSPFVTFDSPFICPPERECGGECCNIGQRCYGGTMCLRDLGPCEENDDCWDDSYCDGSFCVPYGVPPTTTNDSTCLRPGSLTGIEPDVQCEWTGPPAGDTYPMHNQAMSTPAVVDFDMDDDDGTLEPSIVFVSFPTNRSVFADGVLRVIDGRDCSQLASLDDAPLVAASSPAVGDLDGDGRAEIVALRRPNGLIAWRWDAASDSFVQLWQSAVCNPDGTRTEDPIEHENRWTSVSIHDLDDDGTPEILDDHAIYDADGCLMYAGVPDRFGYHLGGIAVVADVDEDGQMELVGGDAIWEWNGTTRELELESYVTMTQPRGHVAVADFGNYPIESLGGRDVGEIAVVSLGQIRVQTIDGTVVFGPFPIPFDPMYPDGGTGGAPTIADFDGDGRVEVATAGGSRYAVFDLDCVDGGDAAGCGGRTETSGILWAQPSQDQTSNVTGSSVFDFDSDGAAEVVYADECFLRIYEGATGDIVYSAPRSSATAYENPVIADVDGDFHTEIVASANDYVLMGLGCPTEDPLRPATSYSPRHGIVVLRDAMDRWAASRRIWSQHAYAITHVGDLGEIPRSSAVATNWREPGLNNFRQNVQGDLEALGVADLTTREISDRLRVPCASDGTATLSARVCNRGALPMGAGFEVSFRRGMRDGPELCRASSPVFLGVAECDEVTCVATLPLGERIDVYVVADPDGEENECHEGNNVGLQPNVACDTVD
jgi:hypothetical protein